ncbi:uncharacterized protein ACNLHF_027971 isoform 1-T1 [Anomaloglossus baeobatrachus]|uniref:uncharacterized protein LOC142249287 n=1 Tax=Anomaloglossus baeobatrachus TaxID=238106 RepID=UPI003F4FE65E
MSQTNFSTFSYNDEESSTIVSRVTTSNKFLATPPEELRGRDYEKELQRQVALDLHLVTLAEYHRTKRIPRGLRVSLRPTLFSDNPLFCDKFEAIINKCSMDIIILTIEFLQKEIQQVSDSIRSTEEQLKQSLSASDLDQLKAKTNDFITNFGTNLETKKRQKFFRDQEDYTKGTVYRWRSGDGSRFQRPYRFGGYASTSDSDGDYGAPRQQQNFLERRPPITRQGGGRERKVSKQPRGPDMDSVTETLITLK